MQKNVRKTQKENSIVKSNKLHKGKTHHTISNFCDDGFHLIK